jgi:hypothetical protein
MSQARFEVGAWPELPAGDLHGYLDDRDLAHRRSDEPTSRCDDVLGHDHPLALQVVLGLDPPTAAIRRLGQEGPGPSGRAGCERQLDDQR